MTRPADPARSPGRREGSAERLLRRSPRGLELASVAGLGALATVIILDIAIQLYFYLKFQQFYTYDSSSRAKEWYVAGCKLLVGMWLTGLAISIARGDAHRGDRGLFSPVALRIWGVVFAVLPLLIVTVWWHAVLHLFHIVIWCWSAAAACFALAARRARRHEIDGRPHPIE